MKFDNSGKMVGFYAGGKTHRGLSLRNMTKLYRHALVLGGEDPKNVNKYSYHGGKRGGISFQKSFGGMSSKEVALGSKHSLGDITDEYTDANRCQLSEPVKRQCDLRDQMQAVLEAKKQQRVEEKQTPKKVLIPGEVQQEKENISPSEVRIINKVLKANGLEMEKIREIDRWHPGFLRCILNIAAESVVGKSSGSNLIKRALLKIKARENKVQMPSRRLDFNKILEENGLEEEKMNNIDRYHPGFSRCVVQIASNPDASITNFGKDLEKRARIYLKNKRRKVLAIKKQDITQDVKQNVGVIASRSIEVLSQENANSGKDEIKKKFKLEVKNELRQKFNSSISQNQPSTVYHGPVFNNCSFGVNAMSNIVPPQIFGRQRASGSQQFKKRHTPKKD